MLLEIAKVVQFFGIRKCRKETGKRDWRGRFFLRLVYVSFTCRLRLFYVIWCKGKEKNRDMQTE